MTTRGGALRRVAEGIYAKGARPVEEVVLGQWAAVLARVAPGAVLAGRSALRKGAFREPGPDGRLAMPGWLFATVPALRSRGSMTLPGLEVRTFPGPGPLEGDIPYLGVHLPSEARALLDNLKPSRARQGPGRTAGRAEVERAVESLWATLREDGMAALVARAGRIAPALDATGEYDALRGIVDVVAGRSDAPLQATDVAARRRRTDPYDPDCMARLGLLATALGRVRLPDRPDPHVGADRAACASFVEAYFTNYIEGTRFLVAKARRIVFEAEEPDGRPADGRDVTQTYAQLSAMHAGMSLAATLPEFVDELRARHRSLMDARPEKRPGMFKVEPNAAGNTVFVMPDLVAGTLREGFLTSQGLDHPFARGLFIHAMLALVHPFDDGNGRSARIMMTKALVVGGQSRAVVPTVYRDDYIAGLRSLSATGAPQAGPLVRAMLRCQEVTTAIAPHDLDETLRVWATTHAFLEDGRNARLTSPDPAAAVEWRNGIPAPVAYWADLDLQAALDDPGAGITLSG